MTTGVGVDVAKSSWFVLVVVSLASKSVSLLISGSSGRSGVVTSGGSVVVVVEVVVVVVEVGVEVVVVVEVVARSSSNFSFVRRSSIQESPKYSAASSKWPSIGLDDLLILCGIGLS